APPPPQHGATRGRAPAPGRVILDPADRFGTGSHCRTLTEIAPLRYAAPTPAAASPSDKGGGTGEVVPNGAFQPGCRVVWSCPIRNPAFAFRDARSPRQGLPPPGICAADAEDRTAGRLPPRQGPEPRGTRSA